ncbi:MAG: ferritin [candidate division WOR-3 bacterium]
MKEELRKKFNEQIVNEFYSAYLYLSMSAYFENLNLTGFSKWLRIQAREEVEHAMKFFDHLLDRNEKVELGEIPAPPNEWESPLKAFKDAYEHERKITSLIYEIIQLAREYNDHAAFEMLQWFAKEQVEEEKITSEVVGRLELAGNSPSAILLLDVEMGKRGD